MFQNHEVDLEYGETLLTLNILVDLEKLETDLKNLANTFIRYNVYSSLRLTIPITMLGNKSVQLKSPTFTPERFHVTMVLSSIQPDEFVPDSIYVGWAYQHSDSHLYQQKEMINLQDFIQLDKMLLGQ